MHRTVLKSKIHRATLTDCDPGHHEPCVVHTDAHNQIINVDSEVATLRAPTAA
jgi:aspartate 1-decarboxylase